MLEPGTDHDPLAQLRMENDRLKQRIHALEAQLSAAAVSRARAEALLGEVWALVLLGAHDESGRVVANVGQRTPQTKVHITKNTAGPTGDAELVMNAARFLMLDKGRPEEQPLSF